MIAGFVLFLTLFLAASQTASAETRTLKFYFLHTGERAEIAYKRNGRYLKSGLNKINHILRDWRRDEPTEMNPLLLDLLWSVYQKAGSRDYIHVVSAYRSPKTNSMLRKASSGVAKKSQHMYGNAIDFFLPDVKLSKLRAIALKIQAGGVGYYPRSGSPFVHLDVGSVRHWPRMSRQQLVALFPDGKTLHLPSNGKPLPGYEQALASYKARKRSGDLIQVADDSKRGRGLLAAIFGGGGGADEEEDNAEAQIASVQPAAPQRRAPEPQQPATILASLSASALPVPATAPRASGEAEDLVPVETEGTPSVDEPQQKISDVLLTLNAPVPTRRPDRASEEDAVQLAAASTDTEFPAAVGYVTPKPRPDRQPSSDPITELLVAQKEDLTAVDEENLLSSASLTLPGGRSDEDSVEQAVVAFSDAQAKLKAMEGTQPVAFLQAGGNDASRAAISKGARTTAKNSRPGPGDAAPRPQPHVMPVRAVTAELVLSRESVMNRKQETKKAVYTARLAAAPDAVYTDGFQHSAAVSEARRFTGSAVNFLSVAKFENE